MLMAQDCKYSVKCHDAYHEEGECYWIFFDYMDGGNFSSLLSLVEGKGAVLSEDFCKQTLYVICRALLELHNKNIIFSDLHPDNVLMKSNGVIKLANFTNSIILN